MKFIPGSTVAAASGSVGGCTYSRNRYGAYIRNRSVPVNPGSDQQNEVRSFLSVLVAAWTSVLTEAQREAWRTWAANTPQIDSLGQAYTMTGQNAYIKANALQLLIGQTRIDTAPSVFAGAALTTPVAISATDATQVLSVGYTNTDQWAGEVGGALLVFTGRPQNASKLYFKGPYRFAGFIAGESPAPASPDPITPAFPFEVDQRVPVKFRAINADGRISADVYTSIIAV